MEDFFDKNAFLKYFKEKIDKVYIKIPKLEHERDIALMENNFDKAFTLHYEIHKLNEEATVLFSLKTYFLELFEEDSYENNDN